MTTRKTIALTIWTFEIGKEMSGRVPGPGQVGTQMGFR